MQFLRQYDTIDTQLGDKEFDSVSAETSNLIADETRQ